MAADRPAFASPPVPGVCKGQMGLTRREYIATEALKGILANPAYQSPNTCWHDAVLIADELIELLDKEENGSE